MPFPADQAGNTVTVLHAAAGKNPVLIIGTNPVGAARNRKSTASADQRGFVRSIVFQVQKLREPAFDSRVLNRPVLPDPADSSVGNTRRIGVIREHAATGIAAEKRRMNTLVDRLFHVI